jgi:hypothetical protein
MFSAFLVPWVLALFGGYGNFVGDIKLSPAKQLAITLHVCSGDPLGNEKQGTLKVLAEPHLVTFENKTASFFSGSEFVVPGGATGIRFMEIGHKVVIKPGAVKDGAVHLDITYTSSTAEDPTPERLRIRTESARTIGTYKFGEVIKLPIGPRSADQQEWIEVIVDEVKP